MSGRYKNIAFGLKSEKKHFKTLKDWFEVDALRKTTNMYDAFDFRDDKNKVVIELKSTNKHKYGTYPRQLVGANKLTEAFKWIDRGYRAFLVFSYVDDDLYSFEITRKSVCEHCEIVENYKYYVGGETATCNACFIDKHVLKQIGLKKKESDTDKFYRDVIEDLEAWGL